MTLRIESRTHACDYSGVPSSGAIKFEEELNITFLQEQRSDLEVQYAKVII